MTVALSIDESGIGVLSVERPQVRNALDWEAMHAFSDHIEHFHAQSGLRVLVITGSQGSFIAGGDLKALHSNSSYQDGIRLAQTMTYALKRLEALPFPTVAAINGPARGGGVEISLACDFRVMDRNANLGFVQIKLGLTPGWGAGQRLLHLVGYSRAMDWLLTGRIIDAEEAFVSGLINRIAPHGEALKDAITLARTIIEQPMDTVLAIKRLLRAGLLLPPGMAAAFELNEFPPLWASDTHHKAVQAFLRR